MSGYSIGWGMPKLFCIVCGGRIGSEFCHRHPKVSEHFQMLYDKWIGISMRRTLNAEQRQ